jgi:uncharacterized protein involved in exopolysaccharide biosynthesis
MNPAVTTGNEHETHIVMTPNWVIHARLLWRHRRLLARVTGIALVMSLVIAFTLQKQYKASASIMPPDQQGSGAMLLAALAGRGGSAGGALGGLGSLAGGLLGGHPTAALYENLLASGTVAGHLIDRFHLQTVYHSKYRMSTAKRLAKNTKITDDKKSGVISITVQDSDPVRARDLAQAYLDELNNLLIATSTSSARQERIFIERRLASVHDDLEQAQLALSEFSSKNSTIDITSQTRAMVEGAARVQAEILVERSGLDAIRQIYGDSNVRVRETEARIGSLQQELGKMGGTSAPLAADGTSTSSDIQNSLYPPLRQLPRLAVPYADLYRRVKVQETVFELLTQQYELSRIEEAKNTPVVSVIDPPGIPERKSSPARLLVALSLTAFSFVVTAVLLLLRESWEKVSANDSRKVLAEEVLASIIRRNSKPTSYSPGEP